MNIFKKIGHWFEDAEKDTVGAAITTIHRGVVVADDMKTQMPTLGIETATVATDVLQCKALAGAVALVVAGGGVNIAADAGVLGALITDGPAIIQLFSDVARLVKTASGDVKQDIGDLEGNSQRLT
jgi:hypothetical protein